MNRISKTIKYADLSLNPYPGCWGPGGTREKPNWCPYCYARRRAEQYRGSKAWPNGFEPRACLDRLEELGHLRQPSIIFMGDAGDLFGAWVPSEDIRFVLQTTQVFRRHTYLFLTQNPTRLPEFNPWPSNCWIGVSATDAATYFMAYHSLRGVEAKVKFLSMEPLLGTPLSGHLISASEVIQWLILGGLTGPGGRKSYPPVEWVEEIEAAADKAGIPIWEKENLTNRRPLRQEKPAERMKHDRDNS